MLILFNEIINYILDYLSYEDLFVCRRVCRRFRRLIDERKFKALNLFYQDYPYDNDLFYLNENAGYANSFRLINCELFKNEKFKSNFMRIKKLSIFYLRGEINDLILNTDDLNCFKELNHLELNKIRSIDGKLNLDNLISLSINTTTKSNLQLNCSKLKALQLGGYLNLDPESEIDNIEYLCCNDQKDDEFYFKICDKFKKIKILEFYSLKSFIFISYKLKDGNNRNVKLKLNEIRIHISFLDDFLFDLMKEFKLNSNTKHIKLIFNNYEFNLDKLKYTNNLIKNYNKDLNFKKLNTIDLNYLIDKQQYLNLFLSSINCLQLDQTANLNKTIVSQLKQIDGILLLNNLEHSISLNENYNDFSFKFNDQIFRTMLSSWKKLLVLTIINIDFKDEQLELMTKYFLNLRVLRIISCKLRQTKFISKFKNLKMICLNFILKEEDLFYLLTNCYQLKKLTITNFNKNKTSMNINCELDCKFKLEILIDNKINKTKEFKSIEKLINYFYSKKNQKKLTG